MNKMRSKNKYRFYCTSNPKTWETLEINEQETSEPVLNKTKRGVNASGGEGARGKGEAWWRVTRGRWRNEKDAR